MSITGESASLSGSSLKGRDHTSASTIAAFNKRRLNGDYGKQPNTPSVGINLESGAVHRSALKATQEKLGPKLWFPGEASESAQRASTLASSNSSAFIPDAHYVEDPAASALASRAASSAIQVSGEEYGAKHQPEAYKWGKSGVSQWSHLGAQRSLAAAAASRDEKAPESRDERLEHNAAAAALREGSMAGLNRPPPQQSIDIAKVLMAAQANAKHRLDTAENHLPANFGVRTEEEKAQRRQQVLSLISIADQRVKSRMAELDYDSKAQGNVFGSLEFQKIALEVATKTHSGRLDNHGKINLGGGLYMTQDEVDDIARRHVQPVLDKVQVVAEKKRIADREHEERQALLRQQQISEKEAERQRKQEEKQRLAEEKAARKHEEQVAKQKRDRAAARAKEGHQPGSHLWHWQQVEIIKEDVKEAKYQRDERQKKLTQLQEQQAKAKEELATVEERHHELKKDYFERGDAIEKKAAEYSENDAETVSLFDLKQQRETVKVNTKNAKIRREELEKEIEELNAAIATAETEQKEAEQQHRELKKKYFEAKAEAEEAERKFQVEEEARLKREAEERAQREAEAEQRRQAEATAAAQRKADAEAAKSSAAATSKSSSGKSAAKASPASAPSPKNSSPATEVPVDYKAPPKSQLLGMGDARSGPILSGYKSQPAKPSSQSPVATPEAASKDSSKDVTEEVSKDAKNVTPVAVKDVATESRSGKIAPHVPAAVESPKNEKAKAERTLNAKPSSLETPKTEAPSKEASKESTAKQAPVPAPVSTSAPAPTSDAAASGSAHAKEIVEDTASKGKDPTVVDSAPSGVAGAIAKSDAKAATLKEDIPLGDAKDQWSGFDSSNVKEKKVDGVFKEEL